MTPSRYLQRLGRSPLICSTSRVRQVVMLMWIRVLRWSTVVREANIAIRLQVPIGVLSPLSALSVFSVSTGSGAKP